MVFLCPKCCNLSFLLLGAATILICLFQGFMPDGQPFCVPFALVQDEGRVLALGEIFVLVEDEISLRVCFILLGWSGDDGCSVALFGWVGIS